MKLGGHLSAASGLRQLVIAARGLNYDYVQIMLSDGRDYAPYEIDPSDVMEFRKMSYGIQLYVHLPYVINPCESNARRANFYKHAYRQHAVLAQTLGARGLILHPGFKKDLDEATAKKHLLKFLESTVTADLPPLLLETDVGSKNGSAIGSLEFIDGAIQDLATEQVQICVDTCHMYARGVDLWNPEIRKRELEPRLRRIKMIHLNSPDPDVTLGSHRDRHNTPFEDRPDWDHAGLFQWVTDKEIVAILERRSIQVQEKDAKFIRSTVGEGLTNASGRGMKRGATPRTKEKKECQSHPTSPSTGLEPS